MTWGTTKQLTAKQSRFVEEYLRDSNATRAALRAGYSTKSAHNSGWENLHNTRGTRRTVPSNRTAHSAVKKPT